ncbi:Lrp/AsnC family transcriptional regulator [Parasphingorhabdus sp. JC815]|uniref:Lrp/AsnC family transcriptional regulator n=1 Tax=Parasphingorhabdus sp. JC815 TaxID=3232140 RepID=UPI0034581C87
MKQLDKPELDELDFNLIEILSNDARLSNRKIAAKLGVTEGTVRGRIKKLQQERLIAFTAVTSPDLQEDDKLAFIGVQTNLDQVDEIASQVSKMSGVTGVIITLGRFNMLVICLFNELGQLHKTASEQILSMPGVHHVETSIAVETVKYNSRIVRITDEEHPLEV